ncbi:Tuberculostearic acid methyltransferase UfaA1, partial [Sesbania bispinosa]
VSSDMISDLISLDLHSSSPTWLPLLRSLEKKEGRNSPFSHRCSFGHAAVVQ